MVGKIEINKLKNQVNECGVLKGHIATKIGVSQAHFSMMLSGKAKMSDEVGKKLSDFLKQAKKIA